MSHIPGHWEDNDQTLSTVGAAAAKKKFGQLKIYKDDKSSNSKVFLKEKNGIDFQLLFFNNRNFTNYKEDANGKHIVENPIGCHIHLIEFEDGADTLYIPLACDVVDFKTHQAAEKSFLDFVNAETDFTSRYGIDTDEVRKIKHAHGAAKTSSHQDKIEKFTPELINAVTARLEKSPKHAEIEHHTKIMKQSSAYMQTPSFKRIYAGGNAIAWLQEAIDDDLLLSLGDYLYGFPK
jgi:hypothetical protein